MTMRLESGGVVRGRRIRRGILAAGLALCAWTAGAQDAAQPGPAWEGATVYRDGWGVPHIYADDPHALAFAFGYAQAEDHLLGMLMAYRIAVGRAAEVLGEAYAESDEFSIKMGHAALAEAALPEASPLTQALCDGFALGVNAWLLEHGEEEPDWVEPIRPADILALWHCYLMSFAPFDLPAVYVQPAGAVSGNAWAVGPSRSADGEPILAINPHTRYDGPFQWYEAHLSTADLDVSGATLFGLPVLLMGHNGMAGWALTPNRPDFAEMYLEPEAGDLPWRKRRLARRIQQAQSMEFRLAGNTVPYYVRGMAGLEERRVPALITPMGPVMGDAEGRYCIYHIGGYGEFGGFDQLIEMGRARTLSHFQRALSIHQLPCFHVIYADCTGSLFYLYNVKVGDKPEPPQPSGDADATPAEVLGEALRRGPTRIDWTRPVPGDDVRFAWRGIVPVAALPSLADPESGYLQACGNPPWAATAGSGLAPGQWPEWLVGDADTLSAARVGRLLELGERSFDDVQAMLHDLLVPLALVAVPAILDAADGNPDWVARAHPDVPAALDALRTWNYLAEADSTGMTVFHVWWAAFQALNGGVSAAGASEAFRLNPPGLQEASLRALERAAQLMRNEFGSLSVPWGDVHRVGQGGREAPLPGAGPGESVFVASGSRFEDGVWRVDYGYAFAMVVRFGAAPEAVSVVPFGASERPDSAHYADQLDLFANGRFKRALFLREEVERHADTAFGRVIRFRPVGIEGAIAVRAPIPVEVRVATSTTPPAPLPADAAAFTLFAVLDPGPRPRPAPVAVELTFQVPEALCAPDAFGQLAVFACDPELGWAPLSEQFADPETRTFFAEDRVCRAYAVLGPADRLLSPGPPDLLATAEPAGPVVPAGRPRAERRILRAGDLRDAQAFMRGAATAAVPPPVPAPEEMPPRAAPPSPPLAPAGVPAVPGPGAGDGPAPMTWGTNLQLPAPGGAGLIRVRAPAPVGVRLVASASAPAELPAALAAFSQYLTLESAGSIEFEQLEVHIRAAAGVCADGDLDKLAVYAYEPGRGWVELPDQQINAERRDFQANASAPATYVLAGPASCYVRN
ncbi:MAG: penicillin acylase family protein [Candidatus Hydrogenedentes bacterium]|nr:penicillin acylase family protein [Candidatus Hydrogenedentota bacterium]